MQKRKKYKLPSLLIYELECDVIVMSTESDDDFNPDKTFESWD